MGPVNDSLCTRNCVSDSLYRWLNQATPALIAPALPAVFAAPGSAHASAAAGCDVRLRIVTTEPVTDDATFVDSFARDHPGYQLTMQWHDTDSGSIMAVDLAGPGPDSNNAISPPRGAVASIPR